MLLDRKSQYLPKLCGFHFSMFLSVVQFYSDTDNLMYNTLINLMKHWKVENELNS